MPKKGILGLRKAKTNSELARPKASKLPRDRVLIVCEGGKTEPNYLWEMTRQLGLTNTDVKICGEECGTDPKSVLRYALEIFQQDNGFDAIYCVFDKEGTPERHKNFLETCAAIKAKKLPGNKEITAIKSVPCFEYWVLLHYKKSTAAFVAKGSKTVGDCAVSAVKSVIPNYTKGMKSLYKIISERTDEAIANSIACGKQVSASGTDNPSTNMHELVERIRKMAKV